jgi:queuine tRNA-ribosyltransferase
MRHLFKAQEILCSMLASYHNLYFLHDLVKNARAAIATDRFLLFKKEFLARYTQYARYTESSIQQEPIEQA